MKCDQKNNPLTMVWNSSQDSPRGPGNYHELNCDPPKSSVQFSPVRLFTTPWPTAHQAFPVHHQLPESTQTHVHWVGDAMQLSHPLLSPPPPAFNFSQHMGFFKRGSQRGFASGGQSIGVSASTSVLPMNTQNWFPFGWTGWISLQSKGLSRVFSKSSVQLLSCVRLFVTP